MVLDEHERVQMEQAFTNVIEEKKNMESYNRFKDLQAQYAQSFIYHGKDRKVEIHIKCRSCYLPLEARMDRDSFEQLLVKTKPKNLVLINGYNTKFEQIKRFCESNKLDIEMKRAD